MRECLWVLLSLLLVWWCEATRRSAVAHRPHAPCGVAAGQVYDPYSPYGRMKAAAYGGSGYKSDGLGADWDRRAPDKVSRSRRVGSGCEGRERSR